MKRALVPLVAVIVWLSSGAVAQEAPASRLEDDYRALERYRPGYSFWRHIFTIRDGSIAFGSAVDGRLVAVFPRKGDWKTEALWSDPALARLLDSHTLPADLDARRTVVARLLEEAIGPVQHNPTRGEFVLPNGRRYGAFLQEWGRIYERFAVPAEIGLAQALIESGLSGTRRSEARAIGFCQWLQSNLRRLNRLAPYVIEGGNQTSQAPYCAAYLSILATKYGSFIPALSEHHSGGVNVGRVLINGERLGAGDVRDRYLRASSLVRDLRQIDLYGYRDIYRTYGPRSYAYAEMVFGNAWNVHQLTASMPQIKIYAMRTPRAIRLADITRWTRLSTDEVRRFNPALQRQVPARGTLYLPMYVKQFGTDVAFWHRQPGAAYSAVLEEFLELEPGAELWDDRRFEPVLRGFQKRFRDTKTEEGTVMAVMLEFVMDDAYTSGRPDILARFRASGEVQAVFERAVRQWQETHGAEAGASCAVSLASANGAAAGC